MDEPKKDEPTTTESGAAPTLEDRIVEAMRTIYDPEIPVNIYDLGLIYDLQIAEGNKVSVKMTLTAPGCPVAGEMPGWVETTVLGVSDVTECDVELVWEPQWNPDMMTEEARLTLNI
jgi:FeS assembly SUF system protein